MINSFTHSKALYLVIRYSLRITTLENHVLGSQSNLFKLSDRTHYTKQRVVSLAANRVMTTHLRNKVLSRRFSIFPLPSTDMSTLVQGTQAHKWRRKTARSLLHGETDSTTDSVGRTVPATIQFIIPKAHLK